MKRWGIGLLLAALSSAGCFGPGAGGHPEIARMTGEHRLAPQTPPPDEVKPSEVNAKNLREKLKQIEEEIRHEETTGQ